MEQRKDTGSLEFILNKKPMKIYLIAFMSCLGIVIVYYMSAGILKQYDYYYRTWLSFTAAIITWFGLPMMFLGYILFILHEIGKNGREKWKKVFSIGGKAVIILGMMLYLIIGGIIFTIGSDEGFEQEEELCAGLLIGTVKEGYLENTRVYRYYDSYSFLLKRECTDSEQVVRLLLEARYQELYHVEEIIEQGNMVVQVFYAYPEEGEASVEEPVHVIRDIGANRYEDDYFYVECYRRIHQYMQDNGIEREVTIRRNKRNLAEEIQIFCSFKDYLQCAQEVTGMISCLTQDSLLEGISQRNILTIVFEQINGVKNSLKLYFDENGKNYVNYISYTNTEYMVGEMEKAFSIQRQNDETIFLGAEEEWEDDILTEDPEEENNTADWIAAAEKDLSTPEGAYKKLYETVFEEQDWAYETSYNAKGNFYGILGVTEEEFQGNLVPVRWTVVHDRVSQNGECILFVAYRIYLKEDGGELSTGIENTYAVNMKTGEVTPSGKKAWADVGSKEYQEAAGEK